MANLSFTRTVVLTSFRTTKTGDYFNIISSANGEPSIFVSMNAYTFNQFSAGNYASITFETAGVMAERKDANGNVLPATVATVVKDVVESDRAVKLKAIDEKQLDYQLAKISKDIEAL